MFNEVRVYNSQEELKSVISPEKLSKRHWKIYWELENEFNLHPLKTLGLKKSDLEFFEQEEEVFV